MLVPLSVVVVQEIRHEGIKILKDKSLTLQKDINIVLK